MRKYIIAGNWKMHGSHANVQTLLTTLKQDIKVNSKAEMIVFPPFVFLEQTRQLLNHTSLKWGAQNVAVEKIGAFTGEISANMLLEFGCQYVLVGHSERRALYGETDEIIAKKFLLAKEAGLIPILCIGETLMQRQQGLTEAVISEQLNAILQLPGAAKNLCQAIVAYEPVWAIGTGQTATPEQAQQIHTYLRQQVAKHDQSIADQLCILYGGSVKSANAEALFSMPDIDGGLVGGASLEAEEFLKIYQAVK